MPNKKEFSNTLDAAYREMARDEAREAEALVWAEPTIGDVQNDAAGQSDA